MKKIIFVCDGDNFSKGSFEFIKILNETEPVLVKGLFFAAIRIHQLAVSYVPLTDMYVKYWNEEKELVRQSREKFIMECDSNNIKYHIYEAGEWDKELFVKETRFADAVVLSEELFYSNVFNYQPNSYMKEALHNAECAVIVIPEDFSSIERIVVAYDGAKEIMQALKQFCYLFPPFTELPVEFVYVKNEETDNIPDDDLLKEYAQLHFNSTFISKLHFDAGKHFATWAEMKKNILLVTGSFSRSAISDLFRRSFAEEIIHDHEIPIFIAHQA